MPGGSQGIGVHVFTAGPTTGDMTMESEGSAKPRAITPTVLIGVVLAVILVWLLS